MTGLPVSALVLVGVIAFAIRRPVRSAADVIGVWRTVEARDATGKDITDRGWRNQFIFTRHHFSIEWAKIDRSKVRGAPTDSQKIAMWQESSFQAGTYTVSHDTLTLNAEIAKTPSAMEPRAFSKLLITRDGTATWLQLVADNSGPLPHQERIKLVRVE